MTAGEGAKDRRATADARTPTGGDRPPPGEADDPARRDAPDTARKADTPDTPDTPGAGAPAMTWDELERRLADGIERMAVESFLILSLPDDEAGSRAYVQLAHWGGDDGSSQGLRVEAAGTANLPATRPLSPAQEALLEGLGWRPPSEATGARNYHRDWPTPAPAVEVAALVVQTLRDVYGVASPRDLHARYSSFEGPTRGELDLGLAAEPRPERRSPKPKMRPPSAPLAPVVEEGLRRLLGVATLARDEDGDYPIKIGSALMFVRLVEGNPPAVAIFSTVLADVEESPLLFAALNDLNRRIRYGRVFWVAGQILVALELSAMDITADQLAFACVQLGSLADHLDDLLHGRFGGVIALPGPSPLVN